MKFIKIVSLLLCFQLLSLYTEDALQADSQTDARLTIALSSRIQELHPLLIDDDYSKFLYFCVARSLTTLNSNWTRACDLCESLPSSKNNQVIITNKKARPKKLEVQWKINSRAHWGDGKEITGHDFKFTWQLATKKDFPTVNKELYQSIENIKVNRDNPKQFVVYFKSVNFRFTLLEDFRLLPRHLEEPIWKRSKGSINEYLSKSLYRNNRAHPGLYFGPYIVASFNNGTSVDLKENLFFYGKKPQIKEIRIKQGLSRQSSARLIKEGGVDVIAAAGLRTDEAHEINEIITSTTSSSQIRRIISDSIDFEHLNFNLRNPILNDKKVRRALFLSLDRNDLMTRVKTIKGILANSFLHPKDPYAIKEERLPASDKAKATALLEEAGWKLAEDGLRYKNSKALTLDLDIPDNSPTREMIAEYLKNQWQKIGININIKKTQQDIFFQKIMQRAQYEGMILFAWRMSVETPSLGMFDPRSIPSTRNDYQGENTGSWLNEQVGRLGEDFEAAIDREKRLKILATIQKHYLEDLPAIPLYFHAKNAFVSEKVSGISLPGFQKPESIWIERWVTQN